MNKLKIKNQSHMPTYKFGLILCLLSLFVGGATAQQSYEKVIKRQFNMPLTGTVEIDSRFGRVDINTSESPGVEFEVTIQVKAESERKAEQIFNRIEVDFHQAGDRVMARTRIAEGGRTLTILSTNDKKESYSINYSVRMPRKANLALTHAYGNAFVDRMEGNSRIKISYGNLKTNRMDGPTQIELAYAKSLGTRFDDLALDMKYSQLDAEAIRKLRTRSSYSKLNAEKIESLGCEIKYDTYRIDAVRHVKAESMYGTLVLERSGSVTIDGKYTNTTIGLLEDRLQANFLYGNMHIKEIAATLQELKFDGKYSNLRIRAPGGDYRIDASTKYGSIRAPGGLIVATDSKHPNEHIFVARKGSMPDAPILLVRLLYGDLKVE